MKQFTGEPATQLGVPDVDPGFVCAHALDAAGAELERLLGRPSVCATLPELGG